MPRPLMYVRRGQSAAHPIELCVIRQGQAYIVEPLTLDEAIGKAADLIKLIAETKRKEQALCKPSTGSLRAEKSQAPGPVLPASQQPLASPQKIGPRIRRLLQRPLARLRFW